MSFPRGPLSAVEYGFQVPEHERWSVGEGLATDTLEQALAFAAAHPGCVVVRRTIEISPWEAVDQ